MPQFNFRNKIIGLLNSMGMSITVAEDADDVTAYDETKNALAAHTAATAKQIEDLTEKAKGYDELKKQVDDLTAAAEAAKTTSTTQASEIEKMKADFDKRILNLRSEIQTELAKEKPEANGEATTTLGEEEPKDKDKKKSVNLWKGNQAPEATVRH